MSVEFKITAEIRAAAASMDRKRWLALCFPDPMTAADRSARASAAGRASQLGITVAGRRHRTELTIATKARKKLAAGRPLSELTDAERRTVSDTALQNRAGAASRRPARP